MLSSETQRFYFVLIPLFVFFFLALVKHLNRYGIRLKIVIVFGPENEGKKSRNISQKVEYLFKSGLSLNADEMYLFCFLQQRNSMYSCGTVNGIRWAAKSSPGQLSACHKWTHVKIESTFDVHPILFLHDASTMQRWQTAWRSGGP